MGAEGAVASGIIGLAQTAYNNEAAAKRAAQDRRENYMYNEWAAQNADKRTRALYSDFYSPEALMRQYQTAGLSPAMMFGGTPGQGGMSGAQGAGANIQTPYIPLNMLEAAQAGLLLAQTKKTEAETANVTADTENKILVNEWQSMINGEKDAEFQLYNQQWEKDDGTPTSLYDIADGFKSFDEFQNYVESKLGRMSEYQQRALRKVYTATYYLDREISALTSDKVSSDFNKSLIEAMKKEDFAKWNAESAVEYLKQNVETNKLEKEQKGAWNELLKRLGKKSETGKDILLIIGMIMDKALTQYRLPSIQPTTIQKNVTYNKE